MGCVCNKTDKANIEENIDIQGQRTDEDKALDLKLDTHNDLDEKPAKKEEKIIDRDTHNTITEIVI